MPEEALLRPAFRMHELWRLSETGLLVTCDRSILLPRSAGELQTVASPKCTVADDASFFGSLPWSPR